MRRLPHQCLAFLAPLPLLACKPAPAATSSPRPELSSGAASSVEPAPRRDPLPPPPAVVYGHFRIPSPTAFLAALRTSPLPATQRTVFEEATFRSFAGMLLGPRSVIAEHVDLSRPMGCVVTSFRLHDAPLACVVGYQGGLTRLVQDLGPEGFLSGGDDHAAYRFEGRSIYLVAMGSDVAFSLAPDLIASTRDQLQRDLLDAPVGDEEFVVTAFPSVIFSDAEDQITAFIEQILRAQPPAPSAYGEAIAESQRRQWMSWGELDRMDLWLDVTPERVRLGYRGTARSGTDTERGYAAMAAPVRDRELLSRLPVSSLVVGAMHVDTSSFTSDPMFGSYMQTLSSLDGSDAAAAIAEQYRKALSVWSELGAGDAAVALLHESGGKGGIAFVYELRPGSDALARLREVFPTTMPEGAPFRFDPRPERLRLGKLRGEAWTMKPTDSMLEPARAGLTKVLGDPPRLRFGYVQHGDRLVMVMTPDPVERYLKRTVAALDGKGSLAAHKDTRSLLEAHAGDTMVFAASFAAIARWLDRIDAVDPLPFPVSERLDDFVLTLRSAGERQREVTIDASASMLGALFKLGQ